MNNNRYLIMILGSARGIDDGLNNIADSEYGVNYVDGNGIFIATFFTHYSVNELYDLLIDWPAMLLFNITNHDSYGINLPTKYYKGLFPEIENIVPIIDGTVTDNEKKSEEQKDLTNINDILDKLQANEYNTDCLTEKEKSILDNFAD